MPQKSAVTMIPVKSSTIKAIGHDGTDLHVEFVHGGKYTFHNVPAKLFNEMLKAPSVGKYFHGRIKGQHKFSKGAPGKAPSP